MRLELRQEYYVLGEYPKREQTGCFRDDLKLLSVRSSFLKANNTLNQFDKEGYQGLMIVKVTHTWR